MECAANWRKENPRKAYKIAYRAIRLANKATGNPPPSHRKEDDRPLKERLMHKYKLNEVRRQNAITAWSGYSDEKRTEIRRKISEAKKKEYSEKSKEAIETSCANARKHINRETQAPAASRGLKQWWAELKKDPERYAAYMSARTESQKRSWQKRKEEAK